MDAFYASVEQRDRPELHGRPVVVGGRSRRAVVAAASYEARTFGIRSALPMFRARRLCPDLVIVEPRMEHYRAVSQQIRAIVMRHTGLIEPLALDEFFLDVSEVASSIADAGALARQMKEEIRAEVGLTASAGVGPNKFVAKIASDLRKPDGLVVVGADGVPGFLAPLPVSRMWGVGKVTERRLNDIGIRTLADLAVTDPARLSALLGKHGPRMVEFARGVDHREVQVSREPKSVSNETTFEEDTTDLALLGHHIDRLAQRVSERLGRRDLAGRTVVLKLTYRNFQHVTRRTTLSHPTRDASVIAAEAAALLGRSAAASRPVRLVGVGVSGFVTPRAASQLTLGASVVPRPTPSRAEVPEGDPSVEQRASNDTVAIIGAGLGGVALVANLGLAGYRLRLHDRDEARITKLRERGGLDVEGLVQGLARLELVTRELAPAVEGADVIIVVTGSHFHAEVARGLAPLLTDGQTILLIQGGTGGSLVVRQELRRAGCRATVDVAEMDNYPYSLGWPEPTRVKMTVVKRFLQIASLPATRIDPVMSKLRAAFPQAVAAPSILTTGLTNMNATLHVVNMIGNIGRLEATGNGYRFYAEGYTPSLITLLEALDAERLALANAFGAKVPGIHAWLRDTYGLGGDSLRETFHRLTHEPAGPYQWTPTPPSLQHKYVIEDVPCGLVAMSSLGRAAGVATPVIDGLVALTSAMLGRDFRGEGRNLGELGLAGKTVSEIRAIVEA